jgi:hypothetical protein
VVTFRAWARRGGKRVAVPGADVRFAGAAARTSASGVVRLRARIARAGRVKAIAARADLRPATVTLRVVRARAAR